MQICDVIEKRYGVIRRFVEEEDASFILNLRLDNRLGRFLSPTNSDLSKQKQWINQYKNREKKEQEFYFIFCDKQTNIQYGVNRIYNIEGSSFEVGSWLFNHNSPEGLSILADLSSRDYAFDVTDANFCKFDVRKENKNVVAYHKRFSPELIGEDPLNYYFKLEKEKYRKYRNQLLKFYGTNFE